MEKLVHDLGTKFLPLANKVERTHQRWRQRPGGKQAESELLGNRRLRHNGHPHSRLHQTLDGLCTAKLEQAVELADIRVMVGEIALDNPAGSRTILTIDKGMIDKLGYLLLIYQIIQVLDGNVLVPLLFSEVVNLHPLAIIIAVLFFGGLFGLWGVFFAIPLATLVQAVLNAWPRARDSMSEDKRIAA